MSNDFGRMVMLAGAAMGGYASGKRNRERDEQDKADRESERQWRQEQRERQQKEWRDQDQERAALSEAAAPTTITAEPPKPDTMDNRDVGQPGEEKVGGYVTGGRMVNGLREGGQRYADQPAAQKAADEYNAPTARIGRMASVVEARDPARASQMRTGVMQERTAQLGLNEAETAHANRMWDAELAKIPTPKAMAELITNSPLGGNLKIEAVQSKDGSKFGFVRINPDGTRTPATTGLFDNTPQGLEAAKLELSRSVPLQQKLQLLHSNAQLEETRRHNKAVEDISRTKVTQAGAPTPPAIWDDGADKTLMGHYQVQDETTGAKTFDADGFKFAQTVGVARSRANGGNKNAALAEAVDIDQQIRAKVGNDPKLVRAARQQYLQRVGLAPGAAPAPAPAPGPAPQPAPAAPPRAPSGQPSAAPSQDYQPPPNSPAAAALRQRTEQSQARNAVRTQNVQVAATAAQSALASGDKNAAAQVARMSGYADLDQNTQIALYKLMNAR